MNFWLIYIYNLMLFPEMFVCWLCDLIYLLISKVSWHLVLIDFSVIQVKCFPWLEFNLHMGILFILRFHLFVIWTLVMFLFMYINLPTKPSQPLILTFIYSFMFNCLRQSDPIPALQAFMLFTLILETRRLVANIRTPLAFMLLQALSLVVLFFLSPTIFSAGGAKVGEHFLTVVGF